MAGPLLGTTDGKEGRSKRTRFQGKLLLLARLARTATAFTPFCRKYRDLGDLWALPMRSRSHWLLQLYLKAAGFKLTDVVLIGINSYLLPVTIQLTLHDEVYLAHHQQLGRKRRCSPALSLARHRRAVFEGVSLKQLEVEKG